jgi:hypothetical protein
MTEDLYLASYDRDKLNLFCEGLLNVIGPMPGKASVDQIATDDGLILPSQPAMGNPNRFYVCIRGTLSLQPSEGIDIVDSEEGKAVLGSWA